MKQRPGFTAYWNEMRAASDTGFTVLDIAIDAKSGATGTVRKYVDFLVRIGAIVKVGERPSPINGRAGNVYRVVSRDRVAPTPKTHGRVRRYGRRQAQLWLAMRHLPTWRVRQLASVASTADCQITRELAWSYVGALLAAGLVMEVRPFSLGVKGRAGGAVAGLYKLRPVANTGPLAPRVERRGNVKRVFDPNRGAYVDLAKKAAA